MKKQSILFIAILILINILLRVYLSERVERVAVDTVIYQSLADSIKSGKGFSLDNRAIIDYAPLYPLLMAIINNRDRLVVVQNIFGLLTMLGLVYLVYESKKIRNIYLALILWNLYIPLTSINFKFLSESLAIFLLILFMASVKFFYSKKWQWQILVGLLWGFLALTRIAYGYVGIAYLLWLLIENRGQKKSLVKLIYGLFLGFLLTMGVWNVRCLALRGLAYPSFYLGRYVVRDEACSNNLCKSLDVLGEKIEKKTGANIWWYLIWKPRQMWDRGDIDSKLPKEIIVWFNRYHALLVIAGLTVALGAIKIKGITRLMGILMWMGIIVHTISWAQPRYVLPLVPILIVIMVANIKLFRNVLKTLGSWWVCGLVLLALFSGVKGMWVWLYWVWFLWLWMIGFSKIRRIGIVSILLTTMWWGTILSIWPVSVNNFLKIPISMWKYPFPVVWMVGDMVVD